MKFYEQKKKSKGQLGADSPLNVRELEIQARLYGADNEVGRQKRAAKIAAEIKMLVEEYKRQMESFFHALKILMEENAITREIESKLAKLKEEINKQIYENIELALKKMAEFRQLLCDSINHRINDLQNFILQTDKLISTIQKINYELRANIINSIFNEIDKLDISVESKKFFKDQIRDQVAESILQGKVKANDIFGVVKECASKSAILIDADQTKSKEFKRDIKKAGVMALDMLESMQLAPACEAMVHDVANNERYLDILLTNRKFASDEIGRLTVVKNEILKTPMPNTSQQIHKEWDRLQAINKNVENKVSENKLSKATSELLEIKREISSHSELTNSSPAIIEKKLTEAPIESQSGISISRQEVETEWNRLQNTEENVRNIIREGQDKIKDDMDELKKLSSTISLDTMLTDLGLDDPNKSAANDDTFASSSRLGVR